MTAAKTAHPSASKTFAPDKAKATSLDMAELGARMAARKQDLLAQAA